MGRVTINGTQSQCSCKKSFQLDMWDVKGNCAKGRSKEALQINRELDNIKAQIIKHYQHLSDREAFVTAEMVRNSYQGVDERLVVEGHAEALGEHSAHRAPAAAHFAVYRYDIVLVHVYLHSFCFFDFTI